MLCCLDATNIRFHTICIFIISRMPIDLTYSERGANKYLHLLVLT